MENDAIEVIVEPTFSEYRRILRERGSEKIKNLRIALGVVFIAVILWLVDMFLAPDFDDLIHRTILWGLIILLAFCVLVYSALIYDIRLQTKKWIGTGEPITYIVGPAGLKSSTRLVTFESSWNRFAKVIETKSDILFILENADFIPIPKRFISEQTTLSQLRSLISENATGSVELLS